jgi:uncharacterized RDD family membrane protein YckC
MMLTAVNRSDVKINPDPRDSQAILPSVSWLTETLQNTGQRIVAQIETETSSLICTERELIAWDGQDEQRAPIGLIKKVSRDGEELVISGQGGVLIRLQIDAPKEDLGAFFKKVRQASLNTRETSVAPIPPMSIPKLEPVVATPQPFVAPQVPVAEMNPSQTSLGRGGEIKTATRLSDFSDPLKAPAPKSEVVPRVPMVANSAKQSREPIPSGAGYMLHPDGFNFEYASRLQRFVASFGDSFIFGFVNRIIDNMTQAYVREQGNKIESLFNQVKQTQDPFQLAQLKRLIAELPSVAANATTVAALLTLVLAWFYYAYFESGERQGTPGKMWQKIGVTDLNVTRIGFLQASKRFFWRMLPAALMLIPVINLQKLQLVNKITENPDISQPIGLMILLILCFILLLSDYVFIFFSKRNQTLHDLLSGTIVVKA